MNYPRTQLQTDPNQFSGGRALVLPSRICRQRRPHHFPSPGEFRRRPSLLRYRELPGHRNFSLGHRIPADELLRRSSFPEDRDQVRTFASRHISPHYQGGAHAFRRDETQKDSSDLLFPAPVCAQRRARARHSVLIFHSAHTRRCFLCGTDRAKPSNDPRPPQLTLRASSLPAHDIG